VITLKGPVTQVQPLVPGVIVVKPLSTAKADIEIALKQVAQITTKCVKNNIEVIDIIVTFGSSKDISKRVKALVEQKEIHLLLFYTAKQAAETENEFTAFVSDMRDWYGLKVVCYR
jgi:hypothetical protein